MRPAKFFKSRKYRSQIFLSITITIVSTICAFSAVTYFNAKQIFQQKVYESDSKILYQVKYNISQMDNGIKNLSSYLFQNNDIRSIMYQKEDFNDMVDLTVKINRLTGSIISSNPYVHSICIYNSNHDMTMYVGKPLFFEDQSLRDIIKSDSYIPKLTLIPRKIENEDKKIESVFTYFMYDTDKSDHMDGALIVNVKYKWFLDNIQMINMVDKNKGDSIFILNDKQQFINEEDSPEGLKNSIIEGYLKNINKQEGFYESKINGKDFLVTYVHVDGLGFTLLKLQPTAEVYKYLNSLKTNVIVVTLGFLILTIIIAMTVSRSIYRPVSNLIKRVASKDSPKTDESSYKDEISYLDQAYIQSFEKLERMDQEKNRYRSLMKSYWMKKLFTESNSLDESSIAELSKEKHLSWVLEQDVMVCILKIDNYREFQKNFNDKHQELIKFAILNISTEVISTQFRSDGADMNEDHVALAIGVGRDQENVMVDIEEWLIQIQTYIHHSYRTMVTACLSNKASHFKEISKLYGDVLNHSAYRFILGRNSIIWPEKINPNIENKKFGYPGQLDDQLLKSLKSGHLTEFQETLRKIFDEVSKLEYNNIMISLIRLTDTLKKAVDASMKSKLRPVYFDFPAISRKLFELETIDDFYLVLLDSVSNFMETNDDQELQLRNSAIIDTVREMVSKHYTDSALCQDQIASTLKISPRRLSRIFKDGMQTSIPEYINAIRLDQALEWLESTNLSVHEIIAKVGIENETYFYNIFKKKFGTTPREYALQKRLNIL